MHTHTHAHTHEWGPHYSLHVTHTHTCHTHSHADASKHTHTHNHILTRRHTPHMETISHTLTASDSLSHTLNYNLSQAQSHISIKLQSVTHDLHTESQPLRQTNNQSPGWPCPDTFLMNPLWGKSHLHTRACNPILSVTCTQTWAISMNPPTHTQAPSYMHQPLPRRVHNQAACPQTQSSTQT